MTFNFDTLGDIIDSRDIIERIAELEAEWEEATGNDIADYAYLSEDDLKAGLNEDDAHELAILREFVEENAGDIEDWEHGASLIHADFFTEYTRELLQDVGYIPADFPTWIVIDWDETADNVAEDYFQVMLNGQTFYVR